MMMFRQTAMAAMAATLALCSLSAHADKKEQIQKVLSVQQPALEDMARGVAEQPARQLAGGARQILLQAVPEGKREATVKQVDAEIKKYLDSAIPTVRASAIKLAPGTIGPVLEERFTEDELKQLVVMLESPILKRYQAALPEMSNALLEKVVEDARPAVNPKLQAAEGNIRKILDTASGGKLSAGEKGAAPAKPAAKK
jgi:hypothetical protein